LKDALADFDKLADSERQIKTEMAHVTHKYNAAKQRYQHHMKDGRLAKGVQLQQDCTDSANKLAEMMSPFAKICLNLNSK